MLTGTPLDLTPFGPLLSGLGALYWLLALGVAVLALWWPRRWRVKVPLALLVLGAFVYPVATHVAAPMERRDEAQARLKEAVALFAVCATSPLAGMPPSTTSGSAGS